MEEERQPIPIFQATANLLGKAWHHARRIGAERAGCDVPRRYRSASRAWASCATRLHTFGREGCNPAAPCASTVAKFSPAYRRPMNNSAICCPCLQDTISEVDCSVPSWDSDDSSQGAGGGPCQPQAFHAQCCRTLPRMRPSGITLPERAPGFRPLPRLSSGSRRAAESLAWPMPRPNFSRPKLHDTTSQFLPPCSISPSLIPKPNTAPPFTRSRR